MRTKLGKNTSAEDFMWNPYESHYYADYQHRFIEKNTGKVQILRR